MDKKVILISGGSDGLGKAIAKNLIKKHIVYILSPNQDKLPQVAQSIGCEYIVADVTDYQSLELAVKKIIDKHAKIDVLVNNAGIWINGSVLKNSPEEIKNVIEVNTLGTIYLSKIVLPYMVERLEGTIINIISQDGLTSKKDRSVYHSSKWAITGFTKCLQEDFESKGIKVIGAYPGLMKTTLFEKKGVVRDLEDAIDPEEVAKIIDYVVSLDKQISIPEIGIRKLAVKNINNMDNQNQDPVVTNPSIPATPPPASPIDITPGADTALQMDTLNVKAPTPDTLPPLPASDTIPTPPAMGDFPPVSPTPDTLPPLPDANIESPLSDFAPIPKTVTPPVAPTAPVDTTPKAPVSEATTPVAPPTETKAAPTTPVATNPLSEDPDQVKLAQ